MKQEDKLSQKDSEKLTRLYEKYKTMLFNTANKILKDRHLAEDAVHKTFEKIIKLLNRIDESNEGKTKKFLYIICRNVALDTINKNKNITPHSDFIDLIDAEGFTGDTEIEDPSNILIVKDSVRRITAMIDKLPIIYRDVMYLEYYYGYKKKEIADLFNVSYDTIKKRHERAKKKLAQILREEEMI